LGGSRPLEPGNSYEDESDPLSAEAISPESASNESSESSGEAPHRHEYRFQLDESEAAVRLDLFLAENLSQFTRSYLQRLVRDGYVTLYPTTKKTIRSALKLRPGTTVRVVIPPPLKVSLAPAALPLEFLYEDEHIAVIDKPAGISVHPAPHQEGPTLVNILLYWLDDLSGIAGVERPGIVHRLDKETSGVLIVAKHDVAHQALSYQFHERLVHKTYLAITREKPREEEGRISHWIGRSPSHSKKQVVRTDGGGRSAITDYRVLETFDGYSLIECYPTTGRTHQIRVHLASIHSPVACDKLYGREKTIYLSELERKRKPAAEEPIIERHALHAASINFRHPVTKETVTFSSPLHEDMLTLLHTLQRYRSPRD